MKFHRITLRDYRAIRLLNIEPRETGITIVQGDNEVGKTSVAEALWLIFEQHDDSSSQLVRSIRPADRDAATEIEVDVSSGPYRFTYFKRFHRGARTELRLKEPRVEVLAGREADNRAKKILEETIDVALWKALRLQQGVAENLDQLPAGQHQSLLAALDGAASELLGGEREQTLFERVEQEYERYFTASGREKNAGDGPNAARLRNARDAATAEVGRLLERIAGLDERTQRATTLDRELANLEVGASEACARVADLEAQVQALRLQQSLVDSLAADLKVAESDLREATSAHEARTRAATSLRTRAEELSAMLVRLQELAGPLTAATAAREEAAARAAATEEALHTAALARDAAEEALHTAGAEFTAQTMTERLERLEKNEPELARVGAWLSECRLDARTLAQIAAAEERLTRLQARREVEGASIEIGAPDGLEFQINGKPVSLEPGRARRGTILGETTITFPGGVTVTVRAGTAAREVEGQIASAQEALDGLLRAANVDSAAAAHGVMRERAAYEERRRGLMEQVAADLRDLASSEELRHKLERERIRIEQLRAAAGTLSIDQAKAARDAAAAILCQAESERDSAREALAQAAAAVASLDRERDQVQERSQALQEEVTRAEADLGAARATASDESLARAAREASEARDSASGLLRDAVGLLETLPDISTDLAAAAAALSDMQATTTRLSHERASIRGVLEDAGAAGLHGQLTEAEQSLSAAEDELEAYLRRANAARVLFETLRRHRDAARENYAKPLRTKIEGLGKLVFGEDFAVELSDDLRVVRRTQGGITLDVGQLSTGVREQLSVLTRLACASLVSDGGGAPLVLDDVFGWADPGRLVKLGPILAHAANEAQVLLFTCTPERFATVAPARVVSLPSGSTEDRTITGESRLVAPPASPRRGAPSPVTAAVQPQAAFDLFGEPSPATVSRR